MRFRYVFSSLVLLGIFFLYSRLLFGSTTFKYPPITSDEDGLDEESKLYSTRSTSVSTEEEDINSYENYIENLQENVGNWRKLSQLIQQRLYNLQHPEDCTKAQKFVCDFDKNCGCCGFGCTLHHFVYCMMMAYGANRTLVLEYSGSAIKEKWYSWFYTFSPCIVVANNTNYTNWNDNKNPEHPVIKLPPKAALQNRPKYLYTIPHEMIDVLNSTFHENAYVWWIGQLLKYVLRPTTELKNEIKEMEERIQFQHPVVGLQIRRTDKISSNEAQNHSLHEYMKHVIKYFDVLENPDGERRVYLATDDPTIFPEATEQYPQYRFLGDVRISESASMETRNSTESLLGIVLDIHFLTESDFLVCTMSSNVCRVAYELKQTTNPNATYASLDWKYIFY